MRRAGEIWCAERANGLRSVAIAMLALCCAAGARAELTPAGTLVKNIASARFSVDGEQASIQSNLVTTRIGEIVDVRLTPKPGGNTAVPPADPTFGIPVILTNTGNGTEAYYVTGTVSGEAKGPSVAVDVDGNGSYDPAIDIDLPSSGQTSPVPAGGSLDLLIRFPVLPKKAGTLDLSARAATDDGAAGTFVGTGDAITVNKDGPVEAKIPFTLRSNDGQAGVSAAPATLAKSQTILAPDGSDTPISGATITYRLELRTNGAERLSDAEIVDLIPAGTHYVPGSIRLNGAAASDTGDSDAARFDGAQIRVALGDIEQSTTNIVTFQVTIL